MTLTRQEMFDRAYRGLRSQDFVRAVSEPRGDLPYYSSACVYETDDGKRCAWGWVDRSLTAATVGDVATLKRLGIGLAADLSDDDTEWVYKLQGVHDRAVAVNGGEPPSLKDRLERFARAHNLTIPE